MDSPLILVGPADLAAYLGISRPGLNKRQELPEPDYHSRSGKPVWLPETAKDWDTEYRQKHGVGRPVKAEA